MENKSRDRETSCGAFEEMLALYHYGELDPVKTSELERHLAECPACRAVRDELALTLGAAPAYHIDRADSLRVARMVKARIARTRPVSTARRLVPTFVAAAAIVVAVAFTLHWRSEILNTHHDQQPQQVILAQGDYEMLDNFDVLGDLDVIEQMDEIDKIEKL
jgi:anti-sigma factor RsiW